MYEYINTVWIINESNKQSPPVLYDEWPACYATYYTNHFTHTRQGHKDHPAVVVVVVLGNLVGL